MKTAYLTANQLTARSRKRLAKSLQRRIERLELVGEYEDAAVLRARMGAGALPRKPKFRSPVKSIAKKRMIEPDYAAAEARVAAYMAQESDTLPVDGTTTVTGRARTQRPPSFAEQAKELKKVRERGVDLDAVKEGDSLAKRVIVKKSDGKASYRGTLNPKTGELSDAAAKKVATKTVKTDAKKVAKKAATKPRKNGKENMEQ